MAGPKRFWIEAPSTVRPVTSNLQSMLVRRGRRMIAQAAEEAAVRKVEARLPRKIRIARPYQRKIVGALPAREYAKAALPTVAGVPVAAEEVVTGLEAMQAAKLAAALAAWRMDPEHPEHIKAVMNFLNTGDLDWDSLTEREKLMLIGNAVAALVTGTALLYLFAPGVAGGAAAMKAWITANLGAAANKVWNWLQDAPIGFQVKNIAYDTFLKDPAKFINKYKNWDPSAQVGFLTTLTQKQILTFQTALQSAPLQVQQQVATSLWGGIKTAFIAGTLAISAIMQVINLALNIMNQGAMTGFMPEESFQMVQFACFAAWQSGELDLVMANLETLKEIRDIMISTRATWGTLSPLMRSSYEAVLKAMSAYIVSMEQAVEAKKKGDTEKEYELRLKAHLEEIQTYYWTLVNCMEQGDQRAMNEARENLRKALTNYEGILNEARLVLPAPKIDIYAAQAEALRIMEEASRKWRADQPVGIAIGAGYYLDILQSVDYKLTGAIKEGNQGRYNVFMNEMKKAIDALSRYLMDYGSMMDESSRVSIEDQLNYWKTIYNDYLKKRPH